MQQETMSKNLRDWLMLNLKVAHRFNLVVSAAGAFDAAKDIMETLRRKHTNLETVLLADIGSRFVTLLEEKLLVVVNASSTVAITNLTEWLKHWKNVLQSNVEDMFAAVLQLEEESRMLCDFHVVNAEVLGKNRKTSPSISSILVNSQLEDLMDTALGIGHVSAFARSNGLQTFDMEMRTGQAE
ncbi:hypothetical protein MLD38_028705 [Melastoma candidum]|uniref:Uncharacterized protein n=1 Tax=Melastoma candidum TaxID=119954 RepID=A0ACB9N1K0_9MYRT|nr:hypothetical protein MLD38_028705 [Melastoma candidum]